METGTLLSDADMDTFIMTRNGHRSDRPFRRPDRPPVNFRCPAKRYRVLSVGLVYGITGAIAGAMAAVMLGRPLVWIVAGTFVGAAVGAWVEAT
jgi:hypothetical protein